MSNLDPRASPATGLVERSTLCLLRSLRWWLSGERRELSIKSGDQGEQGVWGHF